MQQTTEIIEQNDTGSVTPIGRFRSESKQAKRQAKNRGMTTDEISPLIKPGNYQMVYVGRYTVYLHGHCPKLGLRFRIVDIGEYFETELERWYNCKRLVGKPGNNGGFVPPRHGDFLLEYATLFPTVLTRNSRLDRLSFTPFKNNIITGRVDTVKRNHKQRELPGALQYSTIRELLRSGT